MKLGSIWRGAFYILCFCLCAFPLSAAAEHEAEMSQGSAEAKKETPSEILKGIDQARSSLKDAVDKQMFEEIKTLSDGLRASAVKLMENPGLPDAEMAQSMRGSAQEVKVYAEMLSKSATDQNWGYTQIAFRNLSRSMESVLQYYKNPAPSPAPAPATPPPPAKKPAAVDRLADTQTKSVKKEESPDTSPKAVQKPAPADTAAKSAPKTGGADTSAARPKKPAPATAGKESGSKKK